MKLTLVITFDSKVKGQIKIENPPHIPDFGDIVQIDPDDFLKDPEDIKSYKEYGEYGVWLVGFKTTTFEKDSVRVLIVLEEEENFKVNHKVNIKATVKNY
jgi:hypothetical protein